MTIIIIGTVKLGRFSIKGRLCSLIDVSFDRKEYTSDDDDTCLSTSAAPDLNYSFRVS
jgi:hypothetical protein